MIYLREITENDINIINKYPYNGCKKKKIRKI